MRIFTKGVILVLFVVSQVAGYAAAEVAGTRVAEKETVAQVTLVRGNLAVLGDGKMKAQGAPAVAANSVKEKAGPIVSAYPNPTRGLTRLSLTHAGGSDAYKIRLSNTIGKVVRTIEISEFAGGSDITLDLSHLPSGVYFYSLLVNEKMTETKRLVLQR